MRAGSPHEREGEGEGEGDEAGQMVVVGDRHSQGVREARVV